MIILSEILGVHCPSPWPRLPIGLYRIHQTSLFCCFAVLHSKSDWAGDFMSGFARDLITRDVLLVASLSSDLAACNKMCPEGKNVCLSLTCKTTLDWPQDSSYSA